MLFTAAVANLLVNLQICLLNNMRNLLVTAFVLFCLFCCQEKQSELVWNESFFRIGSQSSPRVADLNGDGALDIVMGAGRDETMATEYGIMAVDGLTGKLLWKQKAPAHVVGSASFQDINDDGTPDVFIGGRGGFLTALDGKTGAEIWKYKFDFEEDPVLRYARFNFYNNTWAPDINNDGIKELLSVNGGNWSAPAGSSDGRLPGVLMLFDGKSGAILAADTMPDAQESYMSPLCFQDNDSQQWKIVFGTGGETQSGSLYVAKLDDLLNHNLISATKVASEQGHGYIAPPVLADFNKDGVLDIAAISHASTITMVDGKSYQQLWQQSFPGTESSTSFAVGNYTQKEKLEILAILDTGTWPEYSYAHQVVLDGITGAINYHDTLGCFVVSSAVSYDLDQDGQDEAILNINDYECEYEIKDDQLDPPGITHQLISIDFQSAQHQVIDQASGFRNIFSSPWIGDLDNDGYLDIVYNQYNHSSDLRRFLGMGMKRISTPVKVKMPVKWGAYMGSNGDGIYQ